MNLPHTLQDISDYYHGSKTQIKGGYIHPQMAFNSAQDKLCKGAFVTSDLDQAKFFAINSCISGNGHTKQEGARIYLERLSSHIKQQFYVYTVHGSKEEPFIHDRGTEYYSTKPIKIAAAQKFNTAEEIKRLGYEVCVLDEPLKSSANMRAGNNFDVQAEMAKAIEEGRYHSVDIDATIKQQTNIFRNVVDKLLRKP